MRCFVVWTQGAYTWNIDNVESTKESANKLRRELIKDYGYESSEVKVTELPHENIAYRAQELSVEHENWSLSRLIKAATEYFEY